MGDINLETAEMRCELGTAAGQNSPACSAQSSPYSSAVSESEIDASSLSRHSSCSSLNQQNAAVLTSTTAASSGLTNPYLNGAHTGRSVFRTYNSARSESESATRMRPSCVAGSVSDDDGNAEDSTNSNSYGMQFRCERRNTVEQSGITWRSPVDITSVEQERKTSLPRTLTPSPCASGRSSPACLLVPSHSRVANIRRESNCSMESEASHERLMQIAQQVSLGFDDFSIGGSGERKRTHSLSEPISVLTNAFIPHSCSPSPTRGVDAQKQCYSPSTQQVVRNNITYSPSPSPTPSPRRVMRSLSPIVARQVIKRRYTNSAGGEVDPAGVSLPKRVCQQPYIGSRGCVSPLALENSTNTLESSTKSPEFTGPFCSPFVPRLLVDPAIDVKIPPPLMEIDEDSGSASAQRTNSAGFEDQQELNTVAGTEALKKSA